MGILDEVQRSNVVNVEFAAGGHGFHEIAQNAVGLILKTNGYYADFLGRTADKLLLNKVQCFRQGKARIRRTRSLRVLFPILRIFTPYF